MDQEFSPAEEKPQPDFYIENGLYVFTESYHLKRGTCCQNGCRHCPWKNDESSDTKHKSA
ncbi:MAG: hypothetical protein JWM14_1745 [Chitinophagaceae bacterium]|nr:hypothetical protein [Chitinophagaceae bacterium]